MESLAVCLHDLVDFRPLGAGEIVIDGYTKGDAAKLNVRPGDGLGIQPEDQPSPAWTMKKDGHPIACGGFVDIGHGIAMVWVIASDEVRGHGRMLCRFARQAIDIVTEDLGWHRIQAVVRCDRPEYERWARLMGFEREGRLRKAAPDKSDLYLYARVL